MRLLLDQGLPRSTAAALRGAGIDAEHVGDLGMATANDASILERARSSERVVVTLDADFHALLALSGAAAPSVIRLRAEGLRAGELALLLEKIVAACAVDLAAGAVISADRRQARLRRLPLRS